MIKELYKEITNEISLSISQSKIDSIIKKSITTNGCRVYENGYIGVAGSLGKVTDETWAAAKKNLDLKIPYTFELEKNKVRERDLREYTPSAETFVADMDDLLATLRNEYPDFIFSNKIKFIETETSLTNDLGLNYKNYDSCVNLEIIIKHKSSINVFDSGLINISRKFDKETFLREARKQLDAFTISKALPTGKVPVILDFNEIGNKFIESLNGETLGRGASILSDKIGKEIFSKDFTLSIDRSKNNILTPFFDKEGTTVENDICPLINKGILEKPYTDKKSANQFNFPLTAAASGNYDDVPSLSNISLNAEPGNKTLKELLNGDLGILVIILSGGDYTNNGDYASPVQMSYLTDGENLLGKLPEFNISNNIYSMFGNDFIGITKDKPCFNSNLLVTRMNITPL